MQSPEQNLLIKNLQTLLNKNGPQQQNEQPTKKLRFLFVSTHTHQVTGYSKVSYGILKELAAIPWLEVIHFGFQKFRGELPDTRKLPPNIQQIDASALDKSIQHGFGFDALPTIIKDTKPHIIFIYNDLSVISQFIDTIKKSQVKREFQLWLYIDQVYTMQHMAYIDMVNKEADRIFAFTENWKTCLKEQGVHRPIDVLLHGFDPSIFPKIPKESARKTLGLPDDLFLIMSLNRNQPRKRLDILIMAFVELLVKYPNKPIALMCVTDKGEKGGWWLFEIYMRELKLRGVDPMLYGNRLMITSRDMIYSDDEINVFYNVADIGISCAEGEGFGLCSFEQMGVGVPQVVPAIGGYVEFCNEDNSQLVKPSWRYYLPTAQCPVGGEAHVCDSHAVCLAIEEYLLDSELRQTHGTAARNTVLQYTWEFAVKDLVKRCKREYEDI
jgi:glycosyltransferase involved in cell wall biosynthesis